MEKMTTAEFRTEIAKKFGKTPASANTLTKQIIDYLNANGFFVWRQNNHPTYDVRQAARLVLGQIGACMLSRTRPSIKSIEGTLHKGFRKFKDLHGVPDVIGYHKETGKAVYIEVKVGKDKLSLSQIRFLKDAEKAGCIAFEARNLTTVIEKITQNIEK